MVITKKLIVAKIVATHSKGNKKNITSNTNKSHHSHQIITILTTMKIIQMIMINNMKTITIMATISCR